MPHCFYRSRLKAFSLVELLVSVAVIAVLAAILLPAVGRVRTGAQTAQCASNLRQIGVALAACISDSDMKLPVSWASLPCNPTVRNAGEFNALSGHLAPYLLNNPPLLARVLVPVFQCPAFPSQIASTQAGAPNHITYRLVLGQMGRPNPFGGTESAQAVSIHDIETIFQTDPARVPIIFDLDQRSHYAADASLPSTPVHGDRRNVLYLDGRVSSEAGLDFKDGWR